MARARGILWFLVLVATLLGAAPDGRAADWGGISPGASTIQTVRGRYGAPSRELREKEEGYDTTRWIYEGARAPAGMKRLIVGLGMLTAAGYRPDLVRYFELDPKPLVFDRTTVIRGWGAPDRIGDENGRALLFYKAGLIVYLDITGEDAVSMFFTIPQSEPPPASK
jgi:hypothetical protein